MTKLRMAHASTHGARKPPVPKPNVTLLEVMQYHQGIDKGILDNNSTLGHILKLRKICCMVRTELFLAPSYVFLVQADCVRHPWWRTETKLAIDFTYFFSPFFYAFCFSPT